MGATSYIATYGVTDASRLVASLPLGNYVFPLMHTRTDLKLGHEKSQEYPSLVNILMGDKKYNKRAQVGERCASVEEQVACLIDHATDPNILGRTYGGWEPWI